MHTHIGLDFKLSGLPGTRWANQWIKTIADGIPGSISLLPVPPFTLKPDLAEYVGGPGGTIYEIKRGEILHVLNPAYYLTQAGLAQPQLLTYSTLLNIVTPVTWTYGTRYVSGVHTWPTFKWAPPGWTLVTFSDYAIAPGVILYDFVPSPNAQAIEGLTVIAAAAILQNHAAIAQALGQIGIRVGAGLATERGRAGAHWAVAGLVSVIAGIPI